MLVLYFKLATIKLYLPLSHVTVGLVTHRMRTIEAMTWIPGLRWLPRVLRPRATWALVWREILNPREVHAKK